MIFLAGLLNRSSLSFIFVSFVRLTSILAILFTIAFEIYLITINVHRAHSSSGQDNANNQHLEVSNTTNSNSSTDLSTACGYIIGTNVPKTFGGILFFVLAQIFNILVLILCLLSELSPPKIPELFERLFPPLGQNFGVGPLGSLELYVACALLSNKLQKIGLAVGWYLFVIGIINVLLGIIFGRRIRAKRSLLDAGTAYAKKATHLDDIETGIDMVKKVSGNGKKQHFKNLKKSMIGRPKSSQPEMRATRPLEISRPILNFNHGNDFQNDGNQSLPEPQTIKLPPPIYESFKQTTRPLTKNRRRPSPS